MNSGAMKGAVSPPVMAMDTSVGEYPLANDGATAPSMNGMSASEMERGYSLVAADPLPKDEYGFPMYNMQEDNSGTNMAGDPYARKFVGFCGRPDGNER